MNTISLSLISFLSLLMLSACSEPVVVESESKPAVAPEINSMKIKSDKDTYISNEVMRLKVEINSNTESSCQLAIQGLEVYGENIIYDVISVNLTTGNNIIMYGYELPECNTCAGIPSGNYNIIAELHYDGVVANATKQVTLQ